MGRRLSAAALAATLALGSACEPARPPDPPVTDVGPPAPAACLLAVDGSQSMRGFTADAVFKRTLDELRSVCKRRATVREVALEEWKDGETIDYRGRALSPTAVVLDWLKDGSQNHVLVLVSDGPAPGAGDAGGFRKVLADAGVRDVTLISVMMAFSGKAHHDAKKTYNHHRTLSFYLIGRGRMPVGRAAGAVVDALTSGGFKMSAVPSSRVYRRLDLLADSAPARSAIVDVESGVRPCETRQDAGGPLCIDGLGPFSVSVAPQLTAYWLYEDLDVQADLTSVGPRARIGCTVDRRRKLNGEIFTAQCPPIPTGGARDWALTFTARPSGLFLKNWGRAEGVQPETAHRQTGAMSGVHRLEDFVAASGFHQRRWVLGTAVVRRR